MLSMLTHLRVTGYHDLNFVVLLNGVDALGAETFTLTSGSFTSNSCSADEHKSEPGIRL